MGQSFFYVNISRYSLHFPETCKDSVPVFLIEYGLFYFTLTNQYM